MKHTNLLLLFVTNIILSFLAYFQNWNINMLIFAYWGQLFATGIFCLIKLLTFKNISFKGISTKGIQIEYSKKTIFKIFITCSILLYIIIKGYYFFISTYFFEKTMFPFLSLTTLFAIGLYFVEKFIEYIKEIKNQINKKFHILDIVLTPFVGLIAVQAMVVLIAINFNFSTREIIFYFMIGKALLELSIGYLVSRMMSIDREKE